MGRPMLPRKACVVCGKPCHDLRTTHCSKSCAFTGKQRPSLRDNKFAFKAAGETKWAHYKRMQALCPKGPCVECGAEKAVIHHKDHNPFNTVRENLERLCRACHARHHKQKRAA